MEDNLNGSQEERLVCYEYVPTLQQIACHEIALQLWHHYISYNKSKRPRGRADDVLCVTYGLDENYQEESNEFVEFLNMPRCAKEMAKKSLDTIRVEMEIWIRYFKEIIFKRMLKKYCLHDFNPDYCVWFQNSKIDYKKTAKKILSDAELINEQKFVIMCLHGITDEIESFPLSALSEDFKRRSYNVFEISYWIPSYRIEPSEILIDLVSLIVGEEGTKIDAIMALLCANRFYLFAFEYFWSRLDEEDQISVALRALPKTWQIQKNVSSKMSLHQQREIMSRIPVDLMLNFCIGLDTPEYALKVWLHAKDQTTEEQFASLVGQVYECKISSEDCISVLIDIWDTASDHLRNYVAQTQVDVIFDAVIFNEQHVPSSLKFFRKFLSLTSAVTRQQLILDEADMLAKCADDLNFVNDIVQLCFSTDSEKMKFKNNVMESSNTQEYFIDLINALRFNTLNQKLAFYSSSDRPTRELMKELLNTNLVEVKTFILDYEKWNKLSNFLLEIFANDSSTVAKLKKQLISSFSADAVYYWNKCDDFGEMVKVLEQEFSPLELEAYKQTLWKKFKRGIITSKQFWRYFDGISFNSFVFWCLGDEKKVFDFKMLVCVDEFFDDVFGNICGWYAINRSDYEPHHLLNKLDEYLRCFCADHEEVKKLKIRKFNELNERLFREDWLNFGDRAWYMVLMWFFENDQNEVFKLHSNDSKDTKKRRKLDLMACFR